MTELRDLLPSGPSTAEQDWYAAHQLVGALRSGWRLPAQSTAIALRPGEVAVHTAPCGMSSYYSTSVARRGGGFIAFGSPLLLVASVAGSIGYNAWQNQKAREAAAAQWRHQGHGVAHFTTSRVALATDSGWRNVYFSELEAMEVEPDGVVLFSNNRPREKINLALPFSHFILMRYLAYGEIPDLGHGGGAPPAETVGTPSVPTNSPRPAPALKSTMRKAPEG